MNAYEALRYAIARLERIANQHGYDEQECRAAIEMLETISKMRITLDREP